MNESTEIDFRRPVGGANIDGVGEVRSALLPSNGSAETSVSNGEGESVVSDEVRNEEVGISRGGSEGMCGRSAWALRVLIVVTCSSRTDTTRDWGSDRRARRYDMGQLGRERKRWLRSGMSRSGGHGTVRFLL